MAIPLWQTQQAKVIYGAESLPGLRHLPGFGSICFDCVDDVKVEREKGLCKPKNPGFCHPQSINKSLKPLLVKRFTGFGL